MFSLKRMSSGSAKANPIMTTPGRADLCAEHLPAVQAGKLTGDFQKTAAIGDVYYSVAERVGR
jgi:hypothetical protein